MTDRTLHVSATIHEQMGRESVLFWRRVMSWEGWPVVAKWLGLLVIILTYIPLFWLAVLSFSERPLSGLPYPLTVENYLSLFGDEAWREPLAESVILGLIVGTVCMIVATAVGRAIPQMHRPGGVLLLSLTPLFVPALTMGAALFIFIRSYMGLRLGLWSIFIAHIVWALPFALLLVLVIATRFDYRLLEAASDLGASIVAPVLGHRVPNLAARHYRRRAVRLSPVVQRAVTLDFCARLGDDDADLQLDHGGLAPVPGADHLLARDRDPGHHPAADGWLLLGSVRAP